MTSSLPLYRPLSITVPLFKLPLESIPTIHHDFVPSVAQEPSSIPLHYQREMMIWLVRLCLSHRQYRCRYSGLPSGVYEDDDDDNFVPPAAPEHHRQSLFPYSGYRRHHQVPGTRRSTIKFHSFVSNSTDSMWPVVGGADATEI